MKDKMKNTLTHDVEILGRSVSVLTITALLIVGSASAALLDSFGEITGEAEVDQAFTVDETQGEAELKFEVFDEGVTAGETVVDGPYTMENNQEEAFEPSVTTTLERDEDEVQSLDEAEVVGGDVEWNYEETQDFDNVEDSDDLVGLTTTYVDAYQDAGTSDYEAPDYNSEDVLEVSSASDLDDIVESNELDSDNDDDDDYDAIEIQSDIDLSEVDGSDGHLWITQSDLTVYGEDGDETFTAEVSGSTNGIYVDADGITLTGLELDYSNSDVPSDQWANAVSVYEANAEVSHVSVDSTDETADTGVLVSSDAIGTSDNGDDGAVVSDVEVEEADIGVLVSDTGDQEDDGSVSVESSDFTGTLDYGVVVSAHSGAQHPMGTSVTESRFEISEQAVYVPDDITDPFGKGTDVADVSSGTVAADSNFYFSYPGGVENVNTGYETLSDFEVDGESIEAFGVVNDFSLYMVPDTFSLETVIGDGPE